MNDPNLKMNEFLMQFRMLESDGQLVDHLIHNFEIKMQNILKTAINF